MTYRGHNAHDARRYRSTESMAIVKEWFAKMQLQYDQNKISPGNFNVEELKRAAAEKDRDLAYAEWLETRVAGIDCWRPLAIFFIGIPCVAYYQCCYTYPGYEAWRREHKPTIRIKW